MKLNYNWIIFWKNTNWRLVSSDFEQILIENSIWSKYEIQKIIKKRTIDWSWKGIAFYLSSKQIKAYGVGKTSDLFPWYYGYAYPCPNRDEFVYCLIPFNWVIWAIRELTWKIRITPYKQKRSMELAQAFDRGYETGLKRKVDNDREIYFQELIKLKKEVIK